MIKLTERSQTKQNTYCISHLCKVISGDWKQIRSCGGVGKKSTTKVYQENFENNKYVHHLNYGDDFTKIYMSKFYKLYILLYVNYTAMKFKNIEKNNSWNKLQYIYFIYS